MSAQTPSSAFAARRAAQQRLLHWFQQRHQPSPWLLRSPGGVARMFRQLRAMPRVAPRPRPLRAAAGAASAPAWQPFSVAPLKSQQYGFESGGVDAVAVDPTDTTGNTVYVATAGGVWKSTNALSSSPTFAPLSDNASWLPAGSIAVDASTSPATLYVGTGSPWGMYGAGILKSSDGGQTWALVSAADDGLHPFLGLDFSSIVIDPKNPQHLLAAAASGWFLSAQTLPEQVTPGIYASSDGGQTWQLLLSETDASGSVSGATSLTVDSGTGIFYAAFDGAGFFQSSDGKSWKAMNIPNSYPAFAQPSVAAGGGVVAADWTSGSTTNDQIIVAFSRDGGQTWTTLPTPNQFLWGLNSLAISPAGSDLFICDYGPVFSIDLSASSPQWQERMGTGQPGPAITLTAGSNSIWYAGGPDGLWATADAGSSWINENQDLGIAEVFNTQELQDIGAEATNAGLVQRGGTPRQFPLDPNTYLLQLASTGYDQSAFGLGWVSNDFSSPVLYSLATSQSIVRLKKLAQDAFAGSTTNQFDVDNGNGDLVLTTGSGPEGLWMGPPDTNSSSQWAPLGDTGALDYVAAAPADGSRLYAGSFLSGALITTSDPEDANPLFQSIGIPGLSQPCACPTAPPTVVAVSPADAKVVYAGANGLSGQDVFKSSDGGQTWTDITGNLPPLPVGTIAIDPQNPNDVYIGNDIGVFVATDGGQSGEQWAVYGTGLSHIPVDNLSFSEADQLLASTYGRGVWQIAPLSQKSDFGLRFQNGSVTATPGQSVSFTLQTSAINVGNASSAAPVTLTCVSPATGCSLSSSQISNVTGGSATVTIDASQVKPPMKVVIRGTDGTNTHVLTGFIRPQSGLSLMLMNRVVYVPAGGTSPVDGSDRANLVIGPASAPVTLNCPGIASGLHCSPSLPSATNYPMGQAVPGSVVLSADSSVKPGSYNVSLAATDGTSTAAATLTVQVSDFSLTTPNLTPAYSSSYSLPVTASGSGTESITLSCGPGTLTATCSFQPATITPGQTSTLTITNVQVNPAPPAGTGAQVLDVLGTAGSVISQMNLILPAPPLPQLSFPVGEIPLLAGTDTVSFSGTVASGATLTCAAPKGIQCAVTTGAAASTVTSQVTAALSGLASASTASVTVSATLGAQTQSQVLTVQVLDFGVAAATPPAPVLAGTDTTTIPLATTTQSGFNGAIDLSCAVGATCSFAPARVIAGQSSTLTVSGLASQSGSVPVTVTAASGTLKHNLALSIPIADFQLAAASPTATVATGTDAASFTLTDTSVNGFTDAVQLACSAGVTCSFSPASLPAGGSSTLTVSGLAAQPAGTVKFTVTGTDGADSHTLPLAVAIVTPTLSVSPASLTFADIAVGQPSAAQTITLTNSGSVPVTLAGISASGDFAETSTCGASLDAGASCAVSVTFTPTATGSRSGTLTVKDNADGGPQTVTLSGSGVTPAPAVSLSPASLSFSNPVSVGGKSTSAQTVTLTNSGSAPLTISAITPPADFTETDTCVSGSPLAAGAACTIAMTFAPQSGGNLNENLSITDDAAGSPQSVALTGTAEGLAVQLAQGSSNNQSVKAGGTASYALTLQPENGATGTFTLSCQVDDSKGAMVAGTECAPQPASIDVSSGTPQSVTVAVTTTAATASAAPGGLLPGRWTGPGAIPLMLLLLMPLGLLLADRRRLRWTVAAAGLLGLLLLAGCGGGGGGAAAQPAPGSSSGSATPAGLYTVQFKAAQASITQTVKLKLTVK